MIKAGFKSIVKSDWFINAAARFAWSYIKFVQYSGRWTVLNEDRILPYVTGNKPFIMVFWHNRLLLNVLGWYYKENSKRKPFHMLISKHADGRLISQVMKNFDIHTIEGSTNKQGTAALRQMIKALKSGAPVGITPDGPRGPRFQVSDGVIALARLSGADIIPGISSANHRKILGSWDRFLVAFPFGKSCFAWGEPISVSTLMKDNKNVTKDDIKDQIYKGMMATCDEADAHCGHESFITLSDHLQDTAREQKKREQKKQSQTDKNEASK